MPLPGCVSLTPTRACHTSVSVCASRIDVERPPVWLMRQAGRYMKEFRAYVGSAHHLSVRCSYAVRLSLQVL